jgi:hypothetical protein
MRLVAIILLQSCEHRKKCLFIIIYSRRHMTIDRHLEIIRINSHIYFPCEQETAVVCIVCDNQPTAIPCLYLSCCMRSSEETHKLIKPSLRHGAGVTSVHASRGPHARVYVRSSHDDSTRRSTVVRTDDPTGCSVR